MDRKATNRVENQEEAFLPHDAATPHARPVARFRRAEDFPVPGTYAALILREYGRTPETRAALFDGTGLNELAPGEGITLGQQRRLNANVSNREDSAWALRLGRRYTPATHGVLGFACVSAPTLGDGIAVLERFAHTRAPTLRLRSRWHGSHCVALARQERGSPSDRLRIPGIELVLLSIQCLIASVLGRNIPETKVRLAYPAPPHADQYAAAFHGPVRFQAEETLLVFPSSWLAHESPMADPVTHQMALRQLEALDRGLSSDDWIAMRIEQLIQARRTASLSFAEAASELNVSKRTLTRRLHRLGTSYGEILDDYRRKEAESLLQDSNVDIAEISYRLGYTHGANFGRACRRWFGMSPRSYRSRATETSAGA